MSNKKVHYITEADTLKGYRTICGRYLSFRSKNSTVLEHDVTCINCLNLIKYRSRRNKIEELITFAKQPWYKRLFNILKIFTKIRNL